MRVVGPQIAGWDLSDVPMKVLEVRIGAAIDLYD
jgi:hypothetical protein